MQFIRDDTEHWARQFKAAGIKPSEIAARIIDLESASRNSCN
jgi:hypothetical protein